MITEIMLHRFKRDDAEQIESAAIVATLKSEVMKMTNELVIKGIIYFAGC